MMTMMYKARRLVEVPTKKKVPAGIWGCAEIVADKVSDEGVRPCSPSSQTTDSIVWAVGDVAEVLDEGYWKVSVIEDDLGEDFYQIRVIGSLDEFIVNKSNIRTQQEWKDNMWVPLEQDSETREDLMIRTCKEACMQQQDDFNNVPSIANDCSKSLKRSFSDISYTDEDFSGCTQGERAVNKKARLDAIHNDSCSFIGNGNSHVNFEEIQSIHDDTMFISRASESTDCELLRHGSLIAVFIMMMSWLSTSSLVSQEDIICSGFFAVKAISVCDSCI